MPGQILRFTDGFRDFLVRERVEDQRAFTDVVDATQGSRPRRYIALLSIDGDRVTHAALATRGSRVATGKVRIRYNSIRELTPVALSAIAGAIPPSVRRHFTGNLDLDGWLPEQTWKAALDIVRQDTGNDRVTRDLERLLSTTPPAITPRQLQVLTEERDALGIALQIFDPSLSTVVPSVNSISTAEAPFLVAMQNASMPEDLGIAHDTSVFDGWLPKGVPAVGATTFERHGHELTVANVNRTPVEHVLGVDLIYFHAEYRSFIFVQYKRMARDDENQPYYRPSGKSFRRQYEQTMKWDLWMRAHPTSPGLPSYRLGSDTFFFEIYPNPMAVPAPHGLLRGMYFPLSYWTSLIGSPEVRGPRGGVRITYQNARRYLTNTQFADLVGSGWVGSPPQGEAILANVIAQALRARRSVTLAIAQQA